MSTFGYDPNNIRSPVHKAPRRARSVVALINAYIGNDFFRSEEEITTLYFTDNAERFAHYYEGARPVIEYARHYQDMLDSEVFVQLSHLSWMCVCCTNAKTLHFPADTLIDSLVVTSNHLLTDVEIPEANALSAVHFHNNARLRALPVSVANLLEEGVTLSVTENPALETLAAAAAIPHLAELEVLRNDRLTVLPSPTFLKRVRKVRINEGDIDAWLLSRDRAAFMKKAYAYPGFRPSGFGSYVPASFAKRVYAVGDFHGDYGAAVACFRDVCQVMRVDFPVDAEEPAYVWTAPEGTVVVVLGDLVDRARLPKTRVTPGEIPFEEVRVLHMVNKLAEQASRAGSLVVRLFGNHEISNIGTMKRDEELALANTELHVTRASLHTEFYDKDSKEETTYEDLGLARLRSFWGETYYSLLTACDPKLMVQVGPYLFMHAGVSLDVIYAFMDRKAADGGLNLHGVRLADFANDAIMECVRGRAYDERDPRYAFYKALFHDDSSLLWDREYALESLGYNGGTTALAVEMYNALNEQAAEENPAAGAVAPVDHFVVAHCTQFSRRGKETVRVHAAADPARTDDRRAAFGPATVESDSPFPHGINASADGLVWRVDVGMSRAMDVSWGMRLPAERAAYCRARLPAALLVELAAEGAPTYTLTAKKPLCRTVDSHDEYM
jgi:hypothetical protein